MSDASFSRQQILNAFGVTEEDIAMLEEATGWNAARETAEREREDFTTEVRRRANEISVELSQEVDLDIRWDDDGGGWQ